HPGLHSFTTRRSSDLIASTEPARPAAGQSELEFRQRRGGQGGILEHALFASAARAALFERAGLSMVLYVHALADNHGRGRLHQRDRKSTRLNSSHGSL